MTREVINELKKYTVGKKNTEKTEISVLNLNRLIFALEEQESKTGHYKDRREQRKVTEAMNSLLLPLLPYFSSETAIVVKRALCLLGEIEVEPQESEEGEKV